MKMVRSILLGTAAGFVALAGAQAADLPVKAKPVQYVKICDLYGAGYFYVPGTDTCMKIGGYVRFNAYSNANSGFGYFGVGFGGVTAATGPTFNRRDTQDFTYRSRIWMTGDHRSQTSMGTLRSYYAVQVTNAGPGDTATAVAMPRAFIQLAGWTIGRSTSMFDTPDANSPLTNSGIPGFGGATGPSGIELVAYTANLGNGISASFGLESADQRRRNVINLTRAAAVPTIFAPVNSSLGSGAAATAGGNTPDFVANLDVTQAWGSARVAGALHSVAGDYYTAANTALGFAPGANCVAASPTGCGSPGDTWGYAIAAGFTVTAIPGLPGDLFGVTAGYSHGASGYTLGLNNLGIINGGRASVGQGSDGIFVNGSGIELTDVWFVTGAYQHRWSPTLTSSIFGGYAAVTHSQTAKNWTCTANAGGGGTAAIPAATGLSAVTNCNPDWSYWNVGSRVFNWTPVANFDIGLDVVYWNFNSAYAGSALVPAVGSVPAGTRTLGTENVMTAVLAITRSFWP